jgi:hypothetical protein
MNARAPQIQDPAFQDRSPESCATVQTPQRRLLKDMSAALVEDDKTVRVDLSGLAQSAKAGAEPAGLLNEAPTQRFGAARPAASERPDGESAPPGALPRVASGVRKLGVPPPLPSRPALPPPSMRASRVAVAPEAAVHANARQETTQIGRPHQQNVDTLAIRILRRLTVFAWGFSAATVLWLFLDRHPEWRTAVVDRLTSLWPAYFAKPTK